MFVEKSIMENIRVTLRRYILLILIITTCLFVFIGCSTPVGDSDQIEGDVVVNPDQFEDQMELTLYYPNLSHDPANPESEMVIPVTRIVQKTEALARATVIELLRGPTEQESHEHSVGPVVSSYVELNDIYIKDGICIIHLDYDGPLFSGLNGPVVDAEKNFVQSVLYSLKAVPSISAVWLFYRDSPWQGDFWRYSGPMTIPDRALEYTLYYRNNNANNFDDYIWERVISPVKYVPDNQDFLNGAGNSSGVFFEMVEKLTFSYDQDYGPALPKEVIAVEFLLHKGILTIQLSGRPPVGHQATQVLIRSLVYTFTALPEIERVIATLNGEPLDDGHLIWDTPLGRADLE